MGDVVFADVSVVIPCFRCRNSIRRAVDSVRNQTLLPKEVILVDDCSSDDTLDLLLLIKEQYEENWIKIIALPKNSGPANARNVGWDIATGDFVAFLDSDDTWHPRKIEIQYNWMIGNARAVMTGHRFSELDYKNIHSPNAAPVGEIDLKKHPILIAPYRLLFLNYFKTPGVMIRRCVTVRMNPKKRYSEDYELWLRLSFFIGDCYLFDSVLGYLHKPAYGHSGLSSNLWKMELGELSNYMMLMSIYRFPILVVAILFSALKFFRRFLIVGLRRIRVWFESVV